MRARYVQLIEVVLQTFTSMLINSTISYFYLHGTGYEVTLGTQGTLTAILTVISIIVKYIFRRVSSNYIKRLYDGR